jgi:hypothetical protein
MKAVVRPFFRNPACLQLSRQGQHGQGSAHSVRTARSRPSPQTSRLSTGRR